MGYARACDCQGLAGLVSIRLRRVADRAFLQIRKVPGGGREIAIVVQHDEIMMRCRGADQKVHGGSQRSIRKIRHKADESSR